MVTHLWGRYYDYSCFIAASGGSLLSDSKIDYCEGDDIGIWLNTFCCRDGDLVHTLQGLVYRTSRKVSESRMDGLIHGRKGKGLL